MSTLEVVLILGVHIETRSSGLNWALGPNHWLEADRGLHYAGSGNQVVVNLRPGQNRTVVYEHVPSQLGVQIVNS